MKKISVKLCEWFPANNEFATKMARICILREMLAFEFQCALNRENNKVEGEFGSAFGDMYYFIKMCNSVNEINSAIETLSRDKGYNSFMKRQDVALKNEMKNLKSNLSSTLKLIKEVRHNIGAHVQEKAVNAILKNMNIDRCGLLVIPDPDPLIPKKTHYEFVGELILCMIAGDSPEPDQEEKGKKVIRALLQSLHKIFHRIDILFLSYAKDRKLGKIEFKINRISS